MCEYVVGVWYVDVVKYDVVVCVEGVDVIVLFDVDGRKWGVYGVNLIVVLGYVWFGKMKVVCGIRFCDVII